MGARPTAAAEAALAAVLLGATPDEAARRFGVHPSTLTRLLAHRRANGLPAPPRGKPGPKPTTQKGDKK